MIKFLQSGNKAAKYILGGFLLILAASMVTYLIPGFASDMAPGRTGVVAKVGGQEIHNDEVAKMVQQQTRGQQLPEMYVSIFRQRAIQQLIQHAEVTYEAERMGLKVSDQEVQDELQNGAYKQTFFPDGKWIGADKYKEVITQAGLTVDGFESDFRISLLQQKLIATIGAGATVPDSAIEAAYKERNTKVKFQYAILSLEDIQKSIKPTDAELKAYFEAGKPRYENSIPEKRQIRYFVLQDKDAADKVTVDAADLQHYYSDHQEEYRVQERVRVRHILIKTPPPGPDGKVDQKAVDEARTKAQDILKQIKAGGDFAELAKKYSDDKGDAKNPGSAEKGGEISWIVKNQTVPEFEKVAFSQAKGQISDLVQTSFGFHIIQTEEKEDAHLKPLAEVKAEIEPILKAQKASELREKISTEAAELAKNQGLDKAAAKFKAQVVQSNPVGRSDALPGVGPSPALMDAVFTTAEKSVPQIGRAAQAYVFFEVTKIEPTRTPPLDEIKDKVAKDFKSERAADLLRRKAQGMADRAHAEHDLSKAAKEAGATIKTSELVGRTGQVTDIGSMGGAASVAFGMKSGEISSPINLGGKQAVLEIVDRQEPSLTDPEFAKQRDGLRQGLTEQKQQEALSLFLTDLNARLKKEGKVKIYEADKTNPLKSRS
jgi:peptidyl-prolyl cis-trans isomerase D